MKLFSFGAIFKMSKIITDPFCEFGRFEIEHGLFCIGYLANEYEIELIRDVFKEDAFERMHVEFGELNCQENGLIMDPADLPTPIMNLINAILEKDVSILWNNGLNVTLKKGDRLDDPFLFQNHIRRKIEKFLTYGPLFPVDKFSIEELEAIFEPSFWKLSADASIAQFHQSHVAPYIKNIGIYLDRFHHGEVHHLPF